MKKYLLYDSNCSKCVYIANFVQDASEGNLEAMSIHSRQAVNMLNQAYPKGWNHEPYLIYTNEQGNIYAWSSVQAALRIGWCIGLWSAIQLAATLKQQGNLGLWPSKSLRCQNESRRNLLRVGLATTIAALFVKIMGSSQDNAIFAQPNTCPCSICPPYPCTHISSSDNCVCLSSHCGNCQGCTNDHTRTVQCYCGDCGGTRYCILYWCDDTSFCGRCA